MFRLLIWDFNQPTLRYLTPALLLPLVLSSPTGFCFAPCIYSFTIKSGSLHAALPRLAGLLEQAAAES